MSYLISNDLVGLNELFDQVEIELGLENRVYGALSKYAKGIVKKAEGFFSAVDLHYLTTEEEYFLPTKLRVKALNFRGYSEIRERVIPVPAGLGGDLVGFSKQLLKSAKHVEGIVDNSIIPYTRWLSSNINNPEALTSGRAGNLSDFKPFGVEAEVESLQKFFKKGSSAGEGKLGDFYKRNVEIIDAVDYNFEIGSLLKAIDRNAVLNKVNELVHYLEKLHEIIEDMDEDKISPAAMDAISYTTKEVAKEVEFMGLVFYYYTAFNHSLEKTVKVATEFL